MAGEVMSGLAIFKQLMDTAAGLKDIHDATIRDQAAFTLQKQILEAQTAQFALIKQVGELEEKLTRFETWEAEKERYELVDVGGGNFAYRLKESMSNGQPAHEICANCYERQRKSILKMERWQPMRSRVLVCHECGSVLYVEGQPVPEHEKLRPKGRN